MQGIYNFFFKYFGFFKYIISYNLYKENYHQYTFY